MSFGTGFVLGMVVMAFIFIVTTTTPEKASQNLKEWRSIILRI